MGIEVQPTELWNPAAYLKRVERAVQLAEGTGSTSFLDTCRRCQGAFPTLIAQYAHSTIAENDGYHDERMPYPSPARGEWYFTAESTRVLAEHLGRRPLLLGAPSLGEIATGALLVDSSPWIEERFVLASSVTLIGEAVERTCNLPTCDSALIDPPWYGGVVEDWLLRASNCVRRDGVILVPLLGELTRPTATEDRASIIDASKAIGNVEIVEGAIEYTTPLFEEEAMKAGGVNLDGPWRIADLLIVENERPAERPVSRQPLAEWTDYRIGTHTISVRDQSNRVIGDSNFDHRRLRRLDSVSRRHPLLDQANLWTSRNAIARINDVDYARSILAKLGAQEKERKEILSDIDSLTSLIQDLAEM